MKARPSRVFIIGLGRIAWLLEKDRFRYSPCTHAGTLKSLNEKARTQTPPFELVGASDVDSERLRSFQRWWGRPIPRVSQDFRELFTDADKPDLVIIAASLEAHHEIALHALKTGTGGLLIEKPIAPDLRRAKEIHAAAKKSATPVWVNFERRYHPGYRKLKEIFTSGKLGEPRTVQGRVLTGPVAQAPDTDEIAGPLLHDAVHWIDLLLWYLGEPRSLSARLLPAAAAPDVEDASFITFHYDEFDAFLESGGRREYFEFQLRADFSRGRVVSGNAGHFYYRSAPSRRYARFRELREMTVKLPSRNPWEELYREILLGIRREQGAGNRKKLLITAGLDDALRGMEIIDRCRRL